MARREIDLNATLEQLGVDDNEPSLSQVEKQARVIDLLEARSGIGKLLHLILAARKSSPMP